ncbi:MAG: hypothetical protein K2Y23_03360 [Cyanobacteria bacterium]|nr:hypothetical protein [Cyanobacteriota bacterium]
MLRGVVAAMLAVAVVSAQEPTFDVVMARAAAYVAQYQTQLRGMVLEEHYRQNMMSTATGRPVGPGARARQTREGRELKADLLLVKLADENVWMQFRDVFEVDRKPVRDRDQRLSKLFIDAKADARAQAESIQQESSRYNLGPLMRTFNVPIMALLFLERNVQPVVTFRQGKPGNVKRFDGLAAADAIWMIEYKEERKGTMIKGLHNKDIPSHGRVWLDSHTGRVLQTELISEDTDVRAEINVTYRTEHGLELLVPGEMREIYLIRRSDTRIDGRATYGKFRQFTVSTTEKPKR